MNGTSFVTIYIMGILLVIGVIDQDDLEASWKD